MAIVKRAVGWVLLNLGKAIGMAICEPKVRLGRRRHDGTCDWCEERIGTYAAEKLDFPDMDLETASTREKIRALMAGEYVRICLECSAEVDEP